MPSVADQACSPVKQCSSVLDVLEECLGMEPAGGGECEEEGPKNRMLEVVKRALSDKEQTKRTLFEERAVWARQQQDLLAAVDDLQTQLASVKAEAAAVVEGLRDVPSGSSAALSDTKRRAQYRHYLGHGTPTGSPTDAPAIVGFP